MGKLLLALSGAVNHYQQPSQHPQTRVNLLTSGVNKAKLSKP